MGVGAGVVGVKAGEANRGAVSAGVKSGVCGGDSGEEGVEICGGDAGSVKKIKDEKRNLMSKSLQRARFPQTLYVYTAGDNFNGQRDLDGTNDG